METISETNAGIFLVTVLAVSDDLVVVRPISESDAYVSIVRIPALAMTESAQSPWMADIMSSKNVMMAAQPAENGEMIGELFIDGVPLTAHIAKMALSLRPPEAYPWTMVIEHAHLHSANSLIRHFYDITHLVFMVAVAAVLIGVMSMRIERNKCGRPFLTRWWARAALGWFGFGPESLKSDASGRNASHEPRKGNK